jgi:hypothetical protein
MLDAEMWEGDGIEDQTTWEVMMIFVVGHVSSLLTRQVTVSATVAEG